MSITLNWSLQQPSGFWLCNVTGNDGETRLIKMPRGDTAPRLADVREVVRVIEANDDDERRRLDAEERARLAALRARVKDARQGNLTKAEMVVLLNDVFGDLRDELKG